jgi:hypothetical protein
MEDEMRKILPLGLLLSVAAFMAACGTSSQSASVGYLQGKASIGPLTPVQQAGQPTPTPSPATCTARGLIISNASTGAQVASFSFQPDCTYRVALNPGSYTVHLKPSGIDRSPDLPKTVTIVVSQTVQLNLSIDTGIR